MNFSDSSLTRFGFCCWFVHTAENAGVELRCAWLYWDRTSSACWFVYSDLAHSRRLRHLSGKSLDQEQEPRHNLPKPVKLEAKSCTRCLWVGSRKRVERNVIDSPPESWQRVVFCVYTEQQPENLDQTWYDAMKAGRGHNKPREIPERALSIFKIILNQRHQNIKRCRLGFRMKPERRNDFDAKQQISISSSTGFLAPGKEQVSGWRTRERRHGREKNWPALVITAQTKDFSALDSFKR